MNSLFDLQVLVAVGRYQMEETDLPIDSDISFQGRLLFGDRWDGKTSMGRYPKVCFALGRLRKAGLVDPTVFDNNTWSGWSLTDEGKAIVNSVDINLLKESAVS